MKWRKESPRKKILAILSIISAVAIWGVATSIVKDTVQIIPPYSFLFLRYLLSGIITIPLFFYLIAKVKFDQKRIIKIVIASTLGYVLAISLYFIALTQTTSVNANLISSLTPLLLTVLAFLILRERIKGHQIEGLLIAFIGTFIIIIEPLLFRNASSELSRLAFLGNIILFLGVIADAFYNIYIKKYILTDRVITPFRLIIIGYVVALAVFTPLALVEQYSIYSAKIDDPVSKKSCKIADYDANIYSNEVGCDTYGCYYQPDKEYFCANDFPKTTFTKFVQNNLSDYLSPGTLSSILFMSYVSGILAYILFAMGLRELNASKASILYYLQPVFGVPFAMLYLSEHISSMFIVGAILILSGVIWAEKHQIKK
ncbi:MAG: hypothetical protein QG570_66 [Patescibacteria group bacterium]|nr:hypothetical protein [Patescibacteria group bacterium]